MQSNKGAAYIQDPIMEEANALERYSTDGSKSDGSKKVILKKVQKKVKSIYVEKTPEPEGSKQGRHLP